VNEYSVCEYRDERQSIQDALRESCGSARCDSPPSIDAARIPLREKPTAMPLLANVLVRLYYGTYSKSAKRKVLQHLQRLKEPIERNKMMQKLSNCRL